MPTPSLLIVPSRWKTGSPGKLYSQIPTNGNGDFNVTGVVTGGTSIGTRVNNIGYIEPITTSGTPRLDYYTSSGVPECPALLVEPSGTNLCLQSENFGTSPWNPFDVAITGNVTGTLDPAGGNTADQIFETAVATNHFLAQTTTTTGGITYVGSVFLKKAVGSPDWMQVAYSTTGLGGFANFNLTSGTVGNVGAGCTGRIENYGNGWYRCTLVQTASVGGASGGPVIVFTNNTNPTARYVNYLGNVATSIYAWGAQLETGSVATSYIPTTTGSVTRAADVISVSGAVSGAIGQTEGTIYAEVDIRNLTTADFARIVTLRETANANNFFEIEKRSSTQLRISARLNSGTTTTFLTHPNAFQLGTNKIAFAYQDGNYAMGFNGVVATSSQAGMTSSLNQVILGSSTSSVAQLNDRIRAAALYTTRLTNADLVLLTLPGNNTYLPQAVWDNYLSRTGNSEVPDCLYTRHADLLDV